MKRTNHLSLMTLIIALVLPANALARDIYPDRSLDDIYVLATENSRAVVKAKGTEREYVAVGDVIGEARLVSCLVSPID